ncbi:hypothetical protein Val02_32840 [Virgisporangium aliadipatigenens]|uniref:Uncharacterized protein n=1 Tax=Virgisporangium aliadipatigenens TaxID=741659 RepID=A0A8J3YLN5_9ACTN|nr:hypothetical protein [Virgisporangium aliadipatigenens]GIJ46398.1 hypothetical protein Val02_32840 [Virgisporangium aliadipatigenens]
MLRYPTARRQDLTDLGRLILRGVDRWTVEVLNPPRHSRRDSRS